jgi:hypothetical protein
MRPVCLSACTSFKFVLHAHMYSPLATAHRAVALRRVWCDTVDLRPQLLRCLMLIQATRRARTETLDVVARRDSSVNARGLMMRRFFRASNTLDQLMRTASGLGIKACEDAIRKPPGQLVTMAAQPFESCACTAHTLQTRAHATCFACWLVRFFESINGIWL